MTGRHLLAIVSLLAFATTGFAAPAPSFSTSQVSITGDSFVVDDKAHQAVFTGHVVVVQSTMTVNADRVVAFYGNKGPSSIKTFEATGNVKIVTKDQTATGDKAVYDPTTHLLHLTGNVIVTNASGQVHSTELVVDLKRNTSTFTGSGKPGGRVTGTFTSE